MRRLAVCAAAAFAWASVAAAAGSADALAEAARRIAAAEAGLAQARAAPDRVAALGAAIADCERALAAVRGIVVAAGGEERAITLDLAARRDEIMRLAAALQAMSRIPPPAPSLHPQGPLGAARAGSMLARLTPELRREATELAATLAALADARRRHREGLDELAGGLEALAAARVDLGAAIAERGRGAESADIVAAGLLRDSDTLTALTAALAKTGGGPAGAAVAPGDGARSLRWPVAGAVLLGFNEPDAAGARRPGLTLGAPPQSLVIAPADATVRYAGPFLDYGYVAVLEPEPGTLVVLAGLAQLNVGAGAAVRRGDLLGLLGGRALEVEEYVTLPQASTGAGGSETLYIEIRHGRGPVDPGPWFDGGNGWEVAR